MLVSQSSRPSGRMATVSRGDTPSLIRSRDAYTSCSLDVLACSRARRKSAAGKRFAGLVLEIQPFAFHHQRAVVHLRVDVPDVLADDAHEEKLERSQEEHSNGDGRDTQRELVPEHQFVCEVARAAKHGEQRSRKSRERDQSQRNLGQLGDAEHSEVVERVEIILGLATLAALLLIQNFGVGKADFRNHASEVRVRIAKLAHEVDDLSIIQPKASKVLVGLDVVGETVDQSVKQFPNQEHRRRFAALMLDSNDDRNSLFPLFEQLGENFGRILKVGHKDNDGIAASLQERMHGGADVSEVTRVADNLDIRVGGSNFTEDIEGGVAGRVVDEDVLVAVFSEAQHQVTHAFVDFADITFLVKSGRNHADGFHFAQSAHLPPPAFAA